MKNHKQLLADFYLALLEIPQDHRFRIRHNNLYGEVRYHLAKELGEDAEIVQRIFEQMVAEDVIPIKIICCDCGVEIKPYGIHVCHA